MLLIRFSENIVNYMTFGTWLNYLKLFFVISPTGRLADRSLVVVVVVVVGVGVGVVIRVIRVAVNAETAKARTGVNIGQHISNNNAQNQHWSSNPRVANA